MSRIAFPSICLVVCTIGLDAIQIQVNEPGQGAIAFPPEVVSQLRKVIDNLPTFHETSGGRCNMTEIQSVLMNMQKGIQNAAKAKTAGAASPGANGSAASGMGGGMMGGGMMGGGMMGGGMMGGGMMGGASMGPEVQAACSAPMMGMTGMNWTAMLPCTAAMTSTRPVCAQCFVNTMQDMMGKTMMEMPASCMSKCMAEGQKLGKMGPDCKGCMLPNMEKMFTCIGVDLKAFEFGGAPTAQGYASSLVPLRTITTLLTLMALGVAVVF